MFLGGIANTPPVWRIQKNQQNNILTFLTPVVEHSSLQGREYWNIVCGSGKPARPAMRGGQAFRPLADQKSESGFS